MSVLAKNLITIRKELKCTQSVMSDLLKVGFRSYVRYEAGERDAPTYVLVRLAMLGNVSLEQLLTTEVKKDEIIAVQSIDLQAPPPEVKKCDFRTGQIEFKKKPARGLLALGDKERKLLGFFRRMSLATQKECLESVKKVSKGSGAPEKTVKAGVKLPVKRTSVIEANKVRVRKNGKRGRTSVDKKELKEKIDKLRLVTKSINRITVR